MEHRTVAEHVTELGRAVEAFARSAVEAGLEARVPTCPAWTVRKLLAHQGMIHRWARANLLRQTCRPAGWNAEGQQVADPVAWLREGAEQLVATIEEVPDDVRALVFLADAPAPRLSWARRQCHETTVHAVDALAAALGRFPTPDDAAWVDPAVAHDGIDEILTGFVTRGTKGFADVGPFTFQVRSTQADRGWTVAVQEGGAVRTSRQEGVAATASADGVPTVSGTAVALYLALWNRTPPESCADPEEVLTRVWRTRARVRW